MSLSILNDSLRETTEKHFARFQSEEVLRRLDALCLRARRDGLASIDPAEDLLVRIGMEVEGVETSLDAARTSACATGASGGSLQRVTKNSLGVFDLARQAALHPEWAGRVAEEIAEIRERLRATHGTNIRFVIWAGMGGSMEDKSAYNAIGLLRGGPLVYSLDSTDPEKLKSIVDDMQQRAKEPIAKLLPATLVVGMAMGMTSYEPVVNLEKLAGLYDKFKIDSTANFIYLTLPGSLLDRFAGPRGYRRVPLQLDGGNTTAGRHSAPMTRGSLYPLALAGRDLKEWMNGALLSDDEIAEAFKLSAFLDAQGEAGRDKVTLLLPKSWAPIAPWTKQDFEESLGKSEALGIKIVTSESFNGRIYRKPKDPRQDRVFLAVQRKGEAHPEGKGITALRGAGYPMAALTFAAKAPLSHYMQFMHYVVFGMAYLRKMNFVTQPAVELYKSISAEIFSEAKAGGGIGETTAWKSLGAAKRWHGVVSPETPESLARAIGEAARAGKIEYGELTFFGDTRYSKEGRAMLKTLETAAQRIFRVKLQMPTDVYEGPAMNHSYHEMIIGHGRCFSIVLLAQEQARYATAGYEPDYHMAQFLGTKLALERKRRPVRAILVKDLSPASLAVLERFFTETAAAL